LAAGPWPIVARNGPEISVLGSPTAGIKHRHDGLVGKDPCRGQHHLTQPRDHGGHFGRGVPHPEREGGPLEHDTLPCEDLRLAIQWQVVGIARHQHMGDHRLGRYAALDQPRRRWRLHHDARAGTAGQFWTSRHDDPKLCGDHVKTLRRVLADHCHTRLAARARGVLGRQRHLDPRQVSRQCATTGAPLGRIVLVQFGIPLLRLGVGFGDRLLSRFEAQLQLFLGQLLRLRTELHPRQLQQKMAQPVILCQQGVPLIDRCVPLGFERVTLGHRR
jgi:hypothetical protein